MGGRRVAALGCPGVFSLACLLEAKTGTNRVLHEEDGTQLLARHGVECDYYSEAQPGCLDCANLASTSCRVRRGGSSFDDDAGGHRSAARGASAPEERRGGLGLRCARSAS
jgi:hypothetical protein